MSKGVSERGGWKFEAEPAARRGRTRVSDDERRERAMELYRRLMWALERAEISVEIAAARAGVATDTFRNLREARTKEPSFFAIMIAADVAGVSPFFLAQLTADPDDYRAPKT